MIHTIGNRLSSLLSRILPVVALLTIMLSFGSGAQANVGPSIRKDCSHCPACWNAPFMCLDDINCQCVCGLVYCNW